MTSWGRELDQRERDPSLVILVKYRNCSFHLIWSDCNVHYQSLDLGSRDTKPELEFPWETFRDSDGLKESIKRQISYWVFSWKEIYFCCEVDILIYRVWYELMNPLSCDECSVSQFSQYFNLKLVTRDRDTSRHMSTLHPSDTFMTTNTWQQTCYHFGKIMEWFYSYRALQGSGININYLMW